MANLAAAAAEDDDAASAAAAATAASRASWLHLRHQWPRRIKVFLPGIVASLIITALTLTVPVEKWIGSTAFLMLPYLHLFLYPAPSTLGQHLETVLLALVGAAISLSICFLCLCGTVWIQGSDANIAAYTDARARALGACTLVGLCFLGGYISSAVPRFKNAVRTGLFIAVFCITTGATQISWTIVGNYLYPLAVTAGVSLLANATVFPKTASSKFPTLLTDTVQTICHLIHLATDNHFGIYPARCSDSTLAAGTAQSNSAATDLAATRTRLLTLTSRLPDAVEQASHELNYARVPASTYANLLEPLKRVNGWAACGLGHPRSSSSGGNGGGDDDDDDAAGLANDDHDHVDQLPPHEQQEAPISPSVFRLPTETFAREVVHSFELAGIVIELITASDKLRLPRLRGKKQSTIIACTLPGVHSGGFSSHSNSNDPDRAVLRQRKRLDEAVETFKKSLQSALDNLNAAVEASSVDDTLHRQRQRQRRGEEEDEPLTAGNLRRRRNAGMNFPPANDASPTTDLFTVWKDSMYETSLFMVSLLEIAKEARKVLQASQRQLVIWHANPKRRIWFPIIHWKGWLSQPGSSTLDSLFDSTLATSARLQYNDYADDADHSASANDAPPPPRAGHFSDEELCKRIFADDEEKLRAAAGSVENVSKRGKVRQFSRSPGIVRARLATSGFLQSVKRNRHLRFALKVTLGMAILSLPSWLVSGRQWYVNDRGAWALISYLWVLETSTAATVTSALFRIIGTISGALLGLIAYELSRANPYALCFLVTLFLIPSAILISEGRKTAIGVVSGVTLAIVATLPYVEPRVPGPTGHRQSAPLTAVTRGYEVGAGIVAAVLVNLFLWPYHARVECVANISRATLQMQQLYTSLARQLLQAGLVASAESRHRFKQMEAALQKRLAFSRSLVGVMDAEVSLVVKPVHLLGKILDRLDKSAMLLIALRQCREQGLRHMHTEAVFNVLSARRDLISCVSLSLWTIGQALATRAPLPQFLPSPRAALRELTLALQRELESERAKNSSCDPPPSGASSDAYHALMRVSDLQWQARPSFHRRRSDVPLHDATRRGSPDRSGASTPVRRAFALPKAAAAAASHRPVSSMSMHAECERRRAGAGAGAGADRSRSPTSPLARASQLQPSGEGMAASSGAEKPAPASASAAESSARDPHLNPTVSSAPRRRTLRYTFFWIFAEHSLLSALIDELALLLEETRDLCGEVTFITTEYLSPDADDAARAPGRGRGGPGGGGGAATDSEQDTLMHRGAYGHAYESCQHTTLGTAVQSSAHAHAGLTHLQSVALQEALALRGVGAGADARVEKSGAESKGGGNQSQGEEVVRPQRTESGVGGSHPAARSGGGGRAEGGAGAGHDLNPVAEDEKATRDAAATATAPAGTADPPPRPFRSAAPSGASALRNMFEGV